MTTTDDPAPCIKYRLLESTEEDGYTRQLIEYDSCGDKVSAFLLLPEVLDRMANNVGIEMASVISNFHGKYDIYDLVSCIAPRKLLIVSAKEDKYSRDASYIVDKASPAYIELDALQNLQHKRYPGGHALTKERFDFMIEWIHLNARTY